MLKMLLCRSQTYLVPLSDYKQGAIAMTNNRISAADFERMRHCYHSVSIVLAQHERPSAEDQIFYAEGATFDRAIQNLWIDLCDRTPGGGEAVYNIYGRWSVLNAESFLMDEEIAKFGDCLGIVSERRRDERRSPEIEIRSIVAERDSRMFLGFLASVLLVGIFVPRIVPSIKTGHLLGLALCAGLVGAGVNKVVGLSLRQKEYRNAIAPGVRHD
jgi:hypothetical protein